ncbi:cytochrome P450 77A3-like [Cucumis melo var. makuwa]|uniref:Cytochrome P450 77A3-like n=1 Tax=Cucumis melo var. makuwa TaxID=1194695 RepID=A0A5A7UUQ5_CUCMM|nr:cytochrome P450 77A3-like [Cucumis melo var. makuwa]TYK08174.1 cytochrome P450 77A3-like [Cucumis melo var. makuwa]
MEDQTVVKMDEILKSILIDDDDHWRKFVVELINRRRRELENTTFDDDATLFWYLDTLSILKSRGVVAEGIRRRRTGNW